MLDVTIHQIKIFKIDNIQPIRLDVYILYVRPMGHIGGRKRSFFNRPNVPLYVLQLSVRTHTHKYIYIYMYNIINDKKPVSCSGTIKMWRAAARPLAFAFFSRTRRAQFVGRHPSSIHTTYAIRRHLPIIIILCARQDQRRRP